MIGNNRRALPFLTAAACVAAGLVAAVVGGTAIARAESPSAAEVRAFLKELWPLAHARGVSRTMFDRATKGLVPDPEVIALTARQPEHVKPTGAYVSALVSQERIASGRQLALVHAGVLDAVETLYEVDRNILLAIWGVESLYGAQKGSRNVIRSLATLAMADARRARYWRRELVAALRILQEGAIAPDKYVGSWAGATGHTQFMPSAYAARAVDLDGDGRRDIWESVADALASAANYLRASGWVAGARWGFEVTLPRHFDFAWSAPGRVRTFAEWQAAGVRTVGWHQSPAAAQPLRLILPSGAEGPAFLVSGNFHALLKYNNSAAYALAVGHLADSIAGGAALATPWPANDRPLSRAERQELQALLATWGLNTGGFDGIIGDRTRDAIRATQRSLKLSEDGHPSTELLQRLRASAGP